jgi:hypothetical protein
VDAASLPAGPDHHRPDRALQALVGVGDHQAHPFEAAGPQRAQEGRPEGAVLGVADGQAEHLAAAIGAHAGGDHHRLADDVRALVGLQVGRIQEQVREARVPQRPVAEGTHVLVELGADARDLGLADAGVDAQGLHEVVDLARRDAVGVGLHHDRPQGTVDAPARLQERGEERSGAQLGDPQLQIAGLGREQPVAVAVAVGRPLSGCAGTGPPRSAGRE